MPAEKCKSGSCYVKSDGTHTSPEVMCGCKCHPKTIRNQAIKVWQKIYKASTREKAIEIIAEAIFQASGEV